SPANSVWS
uniref:Conophan mus-V n=1 Tax=Conus mus TaxID=257335 RepID=CONO_CONMU|nr:RecName: Full=Conophan mus-V; AltName: Full=Gamma-hydroxyconophan mus-V* [Conus mus]